MFKYDFVRLNQDVNRFAVNVSKPQTFDLSLPCALDEGKNKK